MSGRDSQLRDLGRGANDTAASYGSIIHGTPDPVQLNFALTNSNPLYPRIDASHPSYQKAWKGLYVFTDENIDNRPKGAGSPDIDHIWYMQCLNGLFDKSKSPYKLAETLNVLGLTEDDILAQEGAALSNTILATGKSTTTNTGPLPILAGQYYYLDYPSTDENKMYTGGCSKMSGVPDKFLCLWTMPYDPKIHRCVPIGLYHAITQYTRTTDSDYGQRENAVGLVAAVLDSVVVALKMLADRGIIDNDIIEAAITDMATTGDQGFGTQFAGKWLAPLLDDGNLLGTDDDIPSFTAAVSEDIFSGGSAFLPTSLQAAKRKPKSEGKKYNGAASIIQQPQFPTLGQKIVAAQLRSAENLCFYANQANSFFTRRIRGKNITIADPGTEMDTIAVGIRGQI